MKFDRQGIYCLDGRPRSEPSNRPEQKDFKEYWTGIVGQDGLYDLQDSAISGWLKNLRVSETGDLRERVMEEVGRNVLRKARPWKAPGLDGITAFWWKGFPTAAQGLFELTRQCVLDCDTVPAWMIRGRTVLIPKEGCQGKPENY